MKTAVVTIAIGDFYQVLSQQTHPTIKAYADKIKAKFIVLDKQVVAKTTPHFEKFALYELLNTYDRIIYIDTDIIIRPDCPNLFEHVPVDKLGAFNEGAFADRGLAMTYARDAYQITPKNWNGKYYNTGVMVLSRRHKHVFKKPEKEESIFYEQSYLNLILARDAVPMFDLSYTFNRMTMLDAPTGEHRLASFIVHYAGFPDPQGLLSVVSTDLESWEKDAPDFKYIRNIHVDVQGGLGDQIEAEPSIRFMKKNVYPDANIVVTSHWPRLFEHIDGVHCAAPGELKRGNLPWYRMCTLPGPATVTWSVVSNLLCHTVDFCSIATLRRTLPDIDKEIKLLVKPEDRVEVRELIGDLTNFVAIHPGRHWVSKTFPVSWWQEVIDKLNAAGVKLVVIGKEDETRGTVAIECPEGVYDTRDRLSLGGFIAIIEMASVCLSNDSSPIHVAGAFDNEIVLIPTCKHPDHLLPYRKGSKSYKTTALYKKLTAEHLTAPTQAHGAVADQVDGDILDYLPDVETVVSTVLSKLAM